MHFAGFFSIVFLSLYEITLGGRLYSSCSRSLAERYCDVRDKMSAVECAQRFEYKRGFEIFENCYNSISETGKDETLEEKLNKVCSLNRDEHIGFSNCCEYAAKLDLLKNRGRLYDVVDLCLYVQEMTENKNCGLYTNRPVLKFYDP
ncbi:uncharacterized protein [Centruroides vittatus]|uniref:uncharacterized protein isoform X2 n=1 Tax=Centruroides vittatus TaxID=120091 RepID=UPI00350FD1A2